MTGKLLQITPAQIKLLLAELPEPDAETMDVSESLLEHIPAFDAAVTQHLYGDAAAMSDEEFERFLIVCGLDRPQQSH